MNAKVFNFSVGDFKCVSISDGMQPIEGDFLPAFFNGSAADELAVELQRHGISPDHYDLDCNCLLIDTGSERLLIDSGGGPFLILIWVNLCRAWRRPVISRRTSTPLS